MKSENSQLMPLAGLRSFLFEDCRGVSSIEFAIIVPVLVLLLIGSVAAFDSYRASKMITRSATTLVDLTTRFQAIDDKAKSDLFKAAKAVTGRYEDDYTDFALVVSSIVNHGTVDSPDLSVSWSLVNDKGTKLTDADLDGLSLPDIEQDKSVVIASVSGKYTPFMTAEIFSSFTFTDSQVRRPRNIDQIPDETTGG